MGLGIEMDTGLGTGRGGLSTQLKRLTKFRSMVRLQRQKRARHPEMGYGWADNERYMQDFELAFWQLTYLVVAPRRVYKQTYHQ